jgi:hypothetical protein
MGFFGKLAIGIFDPCPSVSRISEECLMLL